MKLLTRLLLVVGVVVIGYLAWNVLFPNPQKVVRKRLNDLAKLASFSGKEGNIPRALKSDKIGGFFADKVEFNIDIPGIDRGAITTREEIKQAAMTASGYAKDITTKFEDMQIEVTSGNQAAIVDLTLNATVSGERDPVVQQLKFHLKKIDGDWLITRLQTVKTLNGPNR